MSSKGIQSDTPSDIINLWCTSIFVTTEKTFERLKVSRIPFALLPHQFSLSVSFGHWSFDTCRSFLSLFGKAHHVKLSKESGALILPCLSVNMHSSSYNMLKILWLTLLIQHTNDPRAGHGIKSQPTHCCLGSQQYTETSLQFPHIISAGAAKAPVTQLNN